MLNKKLLGSVSSLPQDDNFENVTLLLNGDGTNGGQNNTFVDSSTNNFTITRNGNTTQGSFSPYGDLWSNYFNGSSYLQTPSNSAFNFSSTDCTIEGWVYPQATGLVCEWGTGASGDLQIYFDNNTMTFGPSGPASKTYFALAANTWNHFAAVKTGTTYYLYINGTRNTTSSGTAASSATTVNIGGRSGGSVYITGYLSNLRITNNVVYTGTTLTVPTTPLTAISGTQLLTCQSNRFIDNSSNAFAITVNGSPSVQRFSPFEPSAPYSTSVIGGSGYFDGSGDYLQTPSNSVFNFSSTDCTVEFWYYGSGSGGLLVEWGTGASGDIQIELSSGTVTFGPSGGASKTFFALQPNAWNHLAAVKTGTTYYLYINGTRNTTSSGTAASSAQTVNIGARSGGTVAITGYLSDIRISNTAVYTGTTLTVPTSPIGTNANTQLLTKFQNASIADLAMQNNLETVGNAQVSTSVKKYGTGSLAFDGTGDILTFPSSPNLSMGSGNFTYELWLYISANNTCVFDTRATNNVTTGFTLLVTSTPKLAIYTNTTNLTCSSTLSTSTWYHVAVVRNGSTLTVYLNGTSDGSLTFTNNLSDSAFRVGQYIDGTGSFNGYIDDLRITKGVARYTANFVPPASSLPTF